MNKKKKKKKDFSLNLFLTWFFCLLKEIDV